MAEEKKPHAVLVVGTLHYSPELTMPVFAKELERFGFRTTVVMGKGNPEKKTENVLPGIEALTDADVAIFFMRFLKLPDSEWQHIENYLKAGKPVIGLRTANHSFKYAKDHPRFDWNDDFGRRALGTPYIVHQGGTTEIKVVPKYKSHPILSNITKTEWVSPGTLYLTRLEAGCVPLVTGTGKGKARLIEKKFGPDAVREYLRDFARSFYVPVKQQLLDFGLIALKERFEKIYRHEGGSFSIDFAEDEMTVKVDACPGVTFMRKNKLVVSALWNETYRTTYETICEGTPFAGELLEYDEQTGRSVMRFWRRK